MTTPREIIAEALATGLKMEWNMATIAMNIENKLTAAGYRILGPDEVADVRRIVEIANRIARFEHWRSEGLATCLRLAADAVDAKGGRS